MRTPIASLLVVLSAGAISWIVLGHASAPTTRNAAAPAASRATAEPDGRQAMARDGGGARLPAEVSDRDSAVPAVERATLRPWSEDVAPARPQAASLELQGTHLVVRLVDAGGAAWSGSPPQVISERLLNGLGMYSSRAPSLRVVPCSPPPLAPAASGVALTGEHLGGDAVDFAVQAGGRYLVSVLHDDFEAAPHVVDVSAEGETVEFVARAREYREPGKLRVQLALPAGLRGGRNVLVRLEDPATGALVSQARWQHETEFELRAPPGRYRLCVRGRPYHEIHHGTLVQPRALGRAERELELASGAELEVTLELGLGARIELQLDGLADDGDRSAVRERLGVPDGRDGVLREERLAALTRVELEGPAGRREDLDRLRMGTWSRSSTYASNDWPLGLRETSESVSAGTWTLVARLPGGREVSTQVVLHAGATTRVQLAFADQPPD